MSPRTMRGRLASAAMGVLFLAVAAPSAASGEPTGPQQEAWTAPRYATLRQLARRLDDTTQGLLDGAGDAALHGSPEEARFLTSIRNFARSARDFRSALDERQPGLSNVTVRVAALAEVARALEERLRAALALEGTYLEWNAVTEILDRMQRLLAGEDVEVPAAYVVPPLSGVRLEEFRQLARALEESTTRSHERAQRDLGSYRDRGAQFLGELHYFAAVSRDLHTRAETGDVTPQNIGPVVSGLLNEAREADRSMRDANVFKEVWYDSSRTITILQQMASLVRSSQ